MQNAQKFKEMLDAEKQEFLAVMSHELRTPMTGVKGYLSMILDGDEGKVTPEIKQCVASAYVANEHLIRLVDDMMKAVTIQEGKIKFNITKVDLTKILEVLVDSFQVPAKEKNLALYYEKPRENVYVYADIDQTGEILENIISNAVKFSEKGKIVISVRFQNYWAIIDVVDTGIGIKREDQDRLFEVFTKGNLKLSSQQKGTGLGLYISRQLAEIQDGKVWLEHSELGVGSTFSIALPVAK